MKSAVRFLLFSTLGCLSSCQTPEDIFIGSRLPSLCNDSYWICNVLAGCVIDPDHYVEGAFPGTRRLVVRTEETDRIVTIQLFLSAMESPGTEFLIQIYEPDCTLDIYGARAHLLDVDLFEQAGDDRTLVFELEVVEAGEHLLEVFSDANSAYVMVVEPD